MHADRTNFASDNVAGVCAPILDAIVRANAGCAPSYGDDELTTRLAALANEVFEREVAIVPVATGTAANGLALATLVPPYGAVYCHAQSHVIRDECAAPEFYTGGAKLIGLPSRDGKLSPAQLPDALALASAMGVHHVRPAAVSIAQATEWGTVYAPDEVAAIAAAARAAGLRLHVDGARFANALAHLRCTPAEATWKAGVDALSLGATKNGALAAEAVVLFDPALAEPLGFRRMRAGHLWSKHRFLSAQLIAYLEGGLWLRNAAQANAMATRLAAGLAALADVTIVQAVQANEVFAVLPEALRARLESAGYRFHRWPTSADWLEPVHRFVCSFDVRERDVDALLACAQP